MPRYAQQMPPLTPIRVFMIPLRSAPLSLSLPGENEDKRDR